MKKSDTISSIAKALSQAQGEFKAPKKDKKSHHGPYSSIDAIIACSKEALCNHGLAVLQELASTEGGITVETHITHESGEWITFGPFFLPCDRTPHKAGSSATYARRYSMCAALGLNGDPDDDANESQSDQEKAIKAKEIMLTSWEIMPISIEQVEKIENLLDMIPDKDTERRMLDTYCIQCIAQIDQRIFSKIVKQLEKKVPNE